MVSATGSAQGDGQVRTVQYAKFRTDKAATPGYSAELISNRVDPQFYDNLDGQPYENASCDTFLKIFRRNVATRPNEPFLGTRAQLENNAQGKPVFGEYNWQSNSEIDRICQNFSKGLMSLNLCPEIEGEGKQWKFLGIWMKNRWEWTASLLACMHFSITAVGFYDAMSAEQVDFILNQTEMKTLVCTGDYAKKIVDMKKSGKAQNVTAIVLTNDADSTLLSAAQEVSIEIHTYAAVQQAGEQASSLPYVEPTKDDIYIFSYTSGTTGDSKGVKLSHNNVLSNARCTIPRFAMVPGEALISYLPYTHSFEQMLFGFCMMQQLRIGFFSGDPTRIAEDCSILRPHFFPSVPRLYNKIYSKIKGQFEAATGCKRWLVDRGVASKQANQRATGGYTSGCWDGLVFKKTKAILGGNVRYMVTGSAPIDKTVIDFLKLCFCCPIMEGYGLTESAAGSAVMDVTDTITGHVGGPNEAVKFRLKDLPEMSYMSTDKPYPRGECCMKGPSIFSGYYKREDKTAECFDEEGWFLTGDVVQVYENGSMKIIDRSKNIFKLSQGEYIAPEKIEGIMGLSQAIAQCFLYGDSFKNACVCIVIPEEDWVKKWAQDNGVAFDFDQLCKSNADLKKAISDEMNKLATEKKLSSLEKPKQFILWPELCSVENNLLTSTFKMKRNVAKEVFMPQIDEMYVKVTAAEEAREGATVGSARK